MRTFNRPLLLWIVFTLTTSAALAQVTVRDLKHMQLALAFFTPTERDADRSLDVSVVDDSEDADAEGLMTLAQARAVNDVLQKDGFYKNAQPLANARWDKQAAPFYILSVDFGTRSIYEKLDAGDASVSRLIDLRDALGDSPAGRTIDGFVAHLDPSRRRWPARATPVPSTQPAQLPPRQSAEHPNYTFADIDPHWNASAEFQKPGKTGLHWIKADWADPSICYTLIEYRAGQSNHPIKSLCLYPSGKIWTEQDDRTIQLDMLPPRGDLYQRAFTEDGALNYYAHWKDGKLMDGTSIDPRFGRERVVDGHGTLTEPGIAGQACRRWVGRGGEVLAQKITMPKKPPAFQLRTDQGTWTMGNGEERLDRHVGADVVEHWFRDKSGVVAYDPGTVVTTMPADERASQYLDARAEFLQHFADLASAEHFTLADIGLIGGGRSPTTTPAAMPTTIPSTAPTTTPTTAPPSSKRPGSI